LESDLVDLLSLYGYATHPIRLSALLRKVPALRVELKESPEVDRINSYMDAGNALRERSSADAILATWALLQIKTMRDAAQPVLRRTAHILRSIKHPAEARALRAADREGVRTDATSRYHRVRTCCSRRDGRAAELRSRWRRHDRLDAVLDHVPLSQLREAHRCGRGEARRLHRAL
jgi:hypothetical protein